MGLWFAAVSERCLDPAPDVNVGHFSRCREHVHSKNVKPVQIPADKNNQVKSDNKTSSTTIQGNIFVKPSKKMSKPANCQ